MKIKHNIFWGKFTGNAVFRMLVIISFNMGWNFLYGLFNLVLALMYHSSWHVTMFVYYIILGLMRSSIVFSKNENKSFLKYNGIAMIFLAVTMSGIIYLSVAESRTTVYDIIIIITIATYTFYQTVISIINMIKARKIKDKKLIVLRNISLASSIGSMFSLECSMLGTFGDIKTSYSKNMEIISGAFAVVIILFLGIFMIKYKQGKEML